MNNTYEYGQNEGAQRREGRVARAIEDKTSRLPSDIFLWAAGASIIGSFALQLIGMRKSGGGMMSGRFMNKGTSPAPLSSFVGLWVPSLLLLGVYNKIVKVAGSDQQSR